MQRVADAILGDVMLERGGWSSRVQYGGRTVSVHLMVDKGADPDRWIELGREVVSRLDSLVPAALSTLGEELLDLANDWRESSSSPPFLAADLVSLFKLSGLLVFDGGTTEFCFDDADIFAGHSVVVDLRPDGRFGNARIAG